jgi:uncharacterized OB-fold protein
MLEKINQASQARHWTDSIPLEFHYTTGVAGQEFARELKEHGRFLSSKCKKCKTSYVPARMFCPKCFLEIKEQIPIEKPGYVYSFTKVEKNRTGDKLDEPLSVVLVKFEGVEGGIVHQMNMSNSSEVSFGTQVEPVLKPIGERTGALTDILEFRPV